MKILDTARRLTRLRLREKELDEELFRGEAAKGAAAAQMPAAEAAKDALSRVAHLFEYRLPAGDVGSIAIDWSGNGAAIALRSRDWLSKGYDGIRIIGAGEDRTHLRCNSHDGQTIVALQHAGIVQLEGVTVHSGFRSCTMVGFPTRDNGQQIRGYSPDFLWRVYGSRFLVEPPALGRTKWGDFGYHADVHFRDVTIDAFHASEHGSYRHGFAQHGSLWQRVTVAHSGAENDKTRSDAYETSWIPTQPWILREDCSYSDCHQLHTDRGGALFVVQGGAANIHLKRCMFHGGPALAASGPWAAIPANARSRCIMVSSEGESYDILTGSKTTGFGNGWVIVEQCGVAYGGAEPSPPWNNELVRVGRTGGSQKAARGVLIDEAGLYGDGMIVQVSDVPAGRFAVRGCNTPAIRAHCMGAGMNTRVEAKIPTSSRLVPVSEGMVR